ncbi:MAG: Bax inhibitor-1/YccA family protein [Treponema sp.]
MTERTDFTGEISRISERKLFLARVYGWMTAALAISGLTAFYTAHSPALFQMLLGGGFFAVAIAELAVVWILSRMIRRMSVSLALFAFIAYSILNGLTLSFAFLAYANAAITRVFFISAGMFAAMTVYGMAAKSDIRSAGRYLRMALIGVIIASLVNIFLRSSGLDWLISVATVVVFTGLTAYDTNKMVIAAEHADGSDMFKKAAIIGALELYLDFINIFLALLRLFGRRK